MARIKGFFNLLMSFSVASLLAKKIARPFKCFFLNFSSGNVSFPLTRTTSLTLALKTSAISSGVAGSRKPPSLVLWLKANSAANITSSIVTSVLFSSAARVQAALLITMSGLNPSTFNSKHALQIASRRDWSSLTFGRSSLALIMRSLSSFW